VSVAPPVSTLRLRVSSPKEVLNPAPYTVTVLVVVVIEVWTVPPDAKLALEPSESVHENVPLDTPEAVNVVCTDPNVKFGGVGLLNPKNHKFCPCVIVGFTAVGWDAPRFPAGQAKFCMEQ